MFVSYSQISVFDGAMENPFNDWTERHVRQGFTWRHGSVSFRTLVESGQVEVVVVYRNNFVPDSASLRTISVPFYCQEGAEIEIATITESHPFPLEPGKYQLVYETGWASSVSWCKFSMICNGMLDAWVLDGEGELSQEESLLMSADPA